jgi:gamma-glutamyltranspeptidase/glutathione hydrolase
MIRDFQFPSRSAVFAGNGICATSHPLAAKVAVQIMEQGGNALDAAIAGAVLLGLCEPGSTGIGGDMFALIKPAGSEEIIGLNASGRSPKAASAEALRAKGWSMIDEMSAHSVVVPGAMAGFEVLARDHGRIGLDACLAPSIRYAEEGVPIAPRAAWDWQRDEYKLTGAARRHYLFNDKPPAVGQVFRAPGQAEVLRRIAKHGAKAFYEGEIAEDMVASLNALGGVHSLEDFANCRADYVTPISAAYRGIEIVEMPPNGHGATALLMARILEHFDLSSIDPYGAERAHLETEATKLAYAARNQAIADPDHMTIPVEHFISPGLAADFAGRIDPKRAGPIPADPIGAPHKDTIYIAAVDRDRMAVSLIYSIYHSFGPGLASDKFGILFNCRGGGFNLTPGHPNELAGGKRPLHTIIPGMMREGGRVVMPFGVMGGAYQPAGHVRLVTNIVDYGMDVQAAIDGPRSFQEGETLMVERGYDRAVFDRLASWGHKAEHPEVALGGAQAIQIDHERGVLIAGSEPRKDGIALGY